MATSTVEKLRLLQTCFSQEQIASYLGTTPEFIAEVETMKRTLSVEQMVRLSDLYDFCNFEK